MKIVKLNNDGWEKIRPIIINLGISFEVNDDNEGEEIIYDNMIDEALNSLLKKEK